MMWFASRWCSLAVLFSVLGRAVTQNDTGKASEADSKGSTLGMNTTSDILDEEALSEKRAQCFREANLTESTNFTCNRSLMVHYSVTEFWTQHASQRMCQEQEKYSHVMECMLEATKGCLPEENRQYFPDAAKVREGLQYICDVAKDWTNVNITCAQQHFSNVFECLRKDTLLVVRDRCIKIPIQPEYICRTYDIVNLCCWEKLQTCGRLTAGAYVRLMSMYLRPPSCPSSGHVTSSSIAVVLLGGMMSFLWLRH